MSFSIKKIAIYVEVLCSPSETFIYNFIKIIAELSCSNGSNFKIYTSKLTQTFDFELLPAQIQQVRDKSNIILKIARKILGVYGERIGLRDLRKASCKIADFSADLVLIEYAHIGLGLHNKLNQSNKLPPRFYIHCHGSDVNAIVANSSRYKQIIAENNNINYIVPSKFLAHKLASIGAKTDNIHICPNPISQIFTSTEIHRTRDCEYFEITSVGSLLPVKGHEFLLEAISNLMQINKLPKKIKINIIGRGPLNNYLKNLAAKLNIDKLITFHGHLKPTEVCKILDSTNLYIQPSIKTKLGHEENYPTAVVEAACRGCPIIASDVGGINEILTYLPNSSYLSLPADSIALANAITKIVNQYDDYLYHATINSSLIKEQFSNQSMITSIQHLLFSS